MVGTLCGHGRLLNELRESLQQQTRTLDVPESSPAVLLVYRRDQDVPPWTGLPTAGCHLALVRRVVERKPDVQVVTFNRSAYRRWHPEELRTAWGAARLVMSRVPQLPSA